MLLRGVRFRKYIVLEQENSAVKEREGNVKEHVKGKEDGDRNDAEQNHKRRIT